MDLDRATRITINNHTQYMLQLSSSHVDGDWTQKWKPPASIAPFSAGSMRSENDTALTGTGGNVVYAVQGLGGEVNIHWKNPWIGLAFYEQGCPESLGIYFTGGKGDKATAEYHLIPGSRVAAPGYLPSTHGFHFTNSFPPEPVMTLPVPVPGVDGGITLTNASQGLCGGMSATSMDYFHMHRWAPADTATPAAGSALLTHLIRRQKSTMLLDADAPLPIPDDGLMKFVEYTNPLYPDTDDMFMGDGHNWITAHEMWPKVKQGIDSGKPIMVGVVLGTWISGGDFGHQVVAYAYQLRANTLSLWVYDPNNPYVPATGSDPNPPRLDGSTDVGVPGTSDDEPLADETVITIDMARTDQHAFNYVIAPNIGHPRIRGMFAMEYEQWESPFGRHPIGRVVLTDNVSHGPEHQIGQQILSIEHGCERGVWSHRVKARPETHTATALFGIAPVTLSWQVGGIDVPVGGGQVPIVGITGTVPTPSPGVAQPVIDFSDGLVAGVTAAATATTVTIQAPPTAGRFSLTVRAHTADGADFTLSLTFDTASIELDRGYVAKLGECHGTLFDAGLSIESPVSDPPWHEIFGPDIPAGPWRPPTPGGPFGDLDIDQAFARHGQMSAILGALSAQRRTSERDALAQRVMEIFRWMPR